MLLVDEDPSSCFVLGAQRPADLAKSDLRARPCSKCLSAIGLLSLKSVNVRGAEPSAQRKRIRSLSELTLRRYFTNVLTHQVLKLTEDPFLPGAVDGEEWKKVEGLIYRAPEYRVGFC